MPNGDRSKHARWFLIALTFALAVGSLGYRLLLLGILLGEGFICILMASPLFYFVGLLIGLVVDGVERRRQRRLSSKLYGVLLLPLLPMALEGTRPELSFARAQHVVREQTVAASAERVVRALSRNPEFRGPLPFYLSLGFPRPVNATGTGLEIGDRHVIHFAGGEGKPGDLILEVMQRGPGLVVFQPVSDTSHIAHWLTWRRAEICWNESTPGQLHIWMEIEYSRSLDPAWYFGPWERYAVGLVCDYWIRIVAAPEQRKP